MFLSLDASVALLAFAPLLAVAMAPMLARLLGGAAGWVLAAIPVAIFAFLLDFIDPLMGGETIMARIDWVPSRGIALGFAVDGLSLGFALAVSGVGALVLIAAGAGLAGHPHQGRLLAAMLVLIGAMLGLVLADDLVVLFAFWQLAGLAGFVLVGFDHWRRSARRAAIQMLVITQIGALALLGTALGLRVLFGTGSLGDLAGLGAAVRGHALHGALLAGVLVAAFTKSAQLPAHFWLANAAEAPMPVVAFLHSAGPALAGIYLLARLSPVFAGTEAWTVTLMLFGAITLVWGGFAAVKQTDLARLLAQTTLAALGVMVMLLGLGGEAAVTAVVIYVFVHALAKAALLLVAGNVDQAAGTREITALGGLMRRMPLGFASALAAAAMLIGLPLTPGFFAMQEMYGALADGSSWHVVALVALIVGNGLVAGAVLAVALKPFIGPPVATPRPAREAGPSFLIGPLVLGAAALAAALSWRWLDAAMLAPAVAAVLGAVPAPRVPPALDMAAPVFWLSALTWALAGLVFLRLAALRTLLRRLDAAIDWTFDAAFDALMSGLVRLSGAVTRIVHGGRPGRQLLVLFALLAAALFVPPALLGGIADLRPGPDALGSWRAVWPDLELHQWTAAGLSVLALLALLSARSRAAAIVCLGVHGISVAWLLALFGSPDLGLARFVVEIAAIVLLALVMARRDPVGHDRRPLEAGLRDATIAMLCGGGIVVLLAGIPASSPDAGTTAVMLAEEPGRLHAILADYRGFDMLGQIAVLSAAGIAVLMLLRTNPPSPTVPRARRRR